MCSRQWSAARSVTRLPCSTQHLKATFVNCWSQNALSDLSQRRKSDFSCSDDRQEIQQAHLGMADLWRHGLVIMLTHHFVHLSKNNHIRHATCIFRPNYRTGKMLVSLNKNSRSSWTVLINPRIRNKQTWSAFLQLFESSSGTELWFI